MKKGFTLIELLAVIVILAIISIIATPIVLNIINDTKESAIVRSAEYYMDAVEQAIMKKNMELGRRFSPKSCVTQNNSELLCDNKYALKLDISGEMPNSATIIMNESNKLVSATLVYGKDTIVLDENKKLRLLGTVCTAAEDVTTGNIAMGNFNVGDEYICEVKPNLKYRFFVLSTNNKNGEVITEESVDKEVVSVNLILDRNINSDGTLVTSAIYEASKVNGRYNMVPWISEQDYGCGVVGDECSLNDKGPITAMKFLDNATKDWINVPNLGIVYEDDGNRYPNILLTGKARLPRYDEVRKVGCVSNEGGTCPVWLVNYLDSRLGLYDGLQNAFCVWGYWTLSTIYSGNSNAVAIQNNGAITYYTRVFRVEAAGIRPVITVSINNINKG